MGIAQPVAAQQSAVQVGATAVSTLFAAINNGDWAKAENLATQLDQTNAQGDLMLAFVYAARFIGEGNCEQGMPFAQAVVQVSPHFLPAYDLVANCLNQRGEQAEAAALYRQAAHLLREGNPERAQLLARAERLSPDLSPSFSIEANVQPSTNINRGTDAQRIGFGQISEKSQRQSGVQIGLFGKVEKPVLTTQRLFASVSLRLGASYLTHTDAFMPEAKIATTVRWLASEKTVVTAEAAYGYVLQDDAFYASRPSVTLDISHQHSETVTLGASAGVTHNRMAQSFMDGYSGFVGGRLIKSLSPSDKVTVSATADWSERRAASQSYVGVGVDAEWEHLWKNGFITSLGAGAYGRRYSGLAPLTNDKQVNKSVYGRVGLSHNKLIFGKVRPEIIYTATKQWSNDVFSEHVAHDVGFRAKAAF